MNKTSKSVAGVLLVLTLAWAQIGLAIEHETYTFMNGNQLVSILEGPMKRVIFVTQDKSQKALIAQGTEIHFPSSEEGGVGYYAMMPMPAIAVTQGSKILWVQQTGDVLELTDPTEKVLDLEKALDRRIVGQTQYKQALVNLAKRSAANLVEANKPAVRLLVAGPDGAGNAQVAKVYAETLDVPFHSLDLADFSGNHPKLVERFINTIATIHFENPFAVIYLKGIEDASAQVQMVIRDILSGEMYGFGEHSFIVTTRGGSERVGNVTLARENGSGSSTIGFISGTSAHRSAAPSEGLPVGALSLRKVLEAEGLPQRYLDVFQDVAPTYPPTRAEFRQAMEKILKEELAMAGERVGVKIRAQNQTAWLNQMSEKIYTPGATFVDAKVIVEGAVGPVVANLVLSGRLKGKTQTSITLPSDATVWTAGCELIVSARQDAAQRRSEMLDSVEGSPSEGSSDDDGDEGDDD